MDRVQIKQRLQEFRNRIDQIVGMFEKNPSQRLEGIAIEYAKLKDDLKRERGKFQTQRGRNQASEDENKFYSHAVEEAYIELDTRSGSSPNRKMMDNLTAARIQISHYLDQLD